jgi:uncharacterized protein YcbK (DUF882 family)
LNPAVRRLVVGLLILFGAPGLSGALVAAGGDDDRTIAFYHIHTKETLTILYKKDGKHIPEAMEKINWIMRDWRKNEVKVIDPGTIDLIWEMHNELGSREPVHIICGYRSRATNEMLRKTVGGQASQSQHITGNAVDIAFPDIPARELRYSALVRERGGVGYYPTSAIPFVHVDSGRVRHWPRMGRDELALLFPSGRSRHEPSDGRPITPADVKAARERRKELAAEVAAYHDKRNAPRAPILVAEASPPAIVPPAPSPAVRPLRPEARMAVGAPPPSPDEIQAEMLPKLAAMPRLVERPSRFTPGPSVADRRGLDTLVTLAAFETELSPPDLVAAPSRPDHPEIAPLAKREPPRKPASPVMAGMITGAIPPLALAKPEPPSDQIGAKLTALELEAPAAEAVPAESGRFGWGSGWAPAPAYDEEHPEELAYRPFPLAPLLTATASADDPALVTLVHPDVAKTLEVLDDRGSVLPMRLRPGRQVAEMMLSQEFRGDVVSVPAPDAVPRAAALKAAGLADRSVRTLPR